MPRPQYPAAGDYYDQWPRDRTRLTPMVIRISLKPIITAEERLAPLRGSLPIALRKRSVRSALCSRYTISSANRRISIYLSRTRDTCHPGHRSTASSRCKDRHLYRTSRTRFSLEHVWGQKASIYIHISRIYRHQLRWHSEVAYRTTFDYQA